MPREAPFVLLDVEHARQRVDDLAVDQEVDREVRVVCRDRRLRLHVEEALAQIDDDAAIDERDQEHEAGPLA